MPCNNSCGSRLGNINNTYCIQWGDITVSRAVGARGNTRDEVTVPVSCKNIIMLQNTTKYTFSSNGEILNNTTISVGGKNSNTSNSATYTGCCWVIFCEI